MKQIDKYFSFISDAVSRPEENAEFYYFLDSERKKLVIVKNKSIGEIDKGYISKLIGLPFLSLKEKIAFLKDYSKNSNDSKIKLIINNYLSEFDENSNIWEILNDIRHVHSEAVHLNFALSNFLIIKANELYKQFSFDESYSIELI